MVQQGAEARDGRPVLGLSRTDPDSVARLLAWVEGRMVAFRAARWCPRTPARWRRTVNPPLARPPPGRTR